MEKGFNAFEGFFMIREGKTEIRGRLCALERVVNASEGVQLHWKGFYALEKVKTRSKEGFYTSKEGFNALEGVKEAK